MPLSSVHLQTEMGLHYAFRPKSGLHRDHSQCTLLCTSAPGTATHPLLQSEPWIRLCTAIHLSESIFSILERSRMGFRTLDSSTLTNTPQFRNKDMFWSPSDIQLLSVLYTAYHLNSKTFQMKWWSVEIFKLPTVMTSIVASFRPLRCFPFNPLLSLFVFGAE